MNRDALNTMIYRYCDSLNILDKCSNITDAELSIEQHKPDVVFLDIEMPGGDGFKLLDRFDHANFKVIFTTAHAEYALKALKFAALDYLLKPIDVIELRQAIQKLSLAKVSGVSKGQIDILKEQVSRSSDSTSRIVLPATDGLEFYDVQSIVRCEADRAYCRFYLSNGKTILISKALKEYEELLTGRGFFRIHKSHLVNLSYIKKYVRGKGGYIVLKDGTNLDVSIRRKDSFLEALSEYGLV